MRCNYIFWSFSVLLCSIVSCSSNAMGWTVLPDSLPRFNECVLLKADLHMHTYYSDGLVSPSERVDEAIKEGFDVIAITDHIERRPLILQYPGDHNRSYDEALEYAKDRVILIKGAEITRDMPPGHINVLFINDANKLEKPDVWDVLAEAKRQNAFFIWNHPGWKVQLPDGPIWFDFHTKMLNENMLQGIEIFNAKEYYEQAYLWAKEKGLTVFANSDLHVKSSNVYNENSVRPYNLIFSKDRTLSAIHTALLAGRTIAVYNGNFCSTNEELMTYFLSSNITISESNHNRQILNKSKYDIVYSILGDSSKPKVLKPEDFVILDENPKMLEINNYFIKDKKNLIVKLNGLDVLPIESDNCQTNLIDSIEAKINIYPNPIRNDARIRYALPTNHDVVFKIYNVLGQNMKIFRTHPQAPGIYEEYFSVANFSNGIYFISMEFGGHRKVTKFVVVK